MVADDLAMQGAKAWAAMLLNIPPFSTKKGQSTKVRTISATLCEVDCDVVAVLHHPIVVPCVLGEGFLEYFILCWLSANSHYSIGRQGQ